MKIRKGKEKKRWLKRWKVGGNIYLKKNLNIFSNSKLIKKFHYFYFWTKKEENERKETLKKILIYYAMLEKF